MRSSPGVGDGTRLLSVRLKTDCGDAVRGTGSESAEVAAVGLVMCEAKSSTPANFNAIGDGERR